MEVKIFGRPISSFRLIVFAISFKLLLSFLLLFAKGYPDISVKDLVCVGDCELGYEVAAYNLLDYGKYTIYSNLAPYTGRLPGYELFLLASTLFSDSNEINYWLIIVVQSVISGISVFCLSAISFQTFKDVSAFAATYLIYLVSTYNSLFDIVALTESLAVSLFIIALYFLIVKRALVYYAIGGAILLYTVLLRQYILPFFLVWVCYVAISSIRSQINIRQIVARISFVLLPFLLFECFWISRNFKLKSKFIPLVDSIYAGYDDENAAGSDFYFSERHKALADFVKCWGGDMIWWNSKAEITAFFSSPTKSLEEQVDMLNSFPNYIYTSQFNKDSLLKIQQVFRSGKVVDSERLISTLNKYEGSFKEERPVYYWIVAPTALLKKFLFHSGTYNLFNKKYSGLSFSQLSFKVFYSGLYLGILLCGFLGMALAICKGAKSNEMRILIFCALYMLLLVMIIRRVEYRHFAFSYPYFVVFSTFFVSRVKQAFKTLSTNL